MATGTTPPPEVSRDRLNGRIRVLFWDTPGQVTNYWIDDADAERLAAELLRALPESSRAGLLIALAGDQPARCSQCTDGKHTYRGDCRMAIVPIAEITVEPAGDPTAEEA